MGHQHDHRSVDNGRRGVSFALLAAVLFGASTPFSKILVGRVDPILLAGLLYLGSGMGLAIWRGLSRGFERDESREASLKLADLPWLASAIISGGVIGPVLLLVGLRMTPASSASLLLNLEGVLTAMLAWFVFKENFDLRIALGMAAITAGGLLVSWGGRPELGAPVGALSITGACLAWAVDNNLTRRVSTGDPVQVAAAKGFGCRDSESDHRRRERGENAGRGCCGRSSFGRACRLWHQPDSFRASAPPHWNGQDRRLFLRGSFRWSNDLNCRLTRRCDCLLCRCCCTDGARRLATPDRAA
jgi:uncharacterized membrane protein